MYLIFIQIGIYTVKHDIHIHSQMLSLVVLPALLVVCNAAPGGYTGYGGLYPNMNQNADYMAHAKSAAKLASQIAFEEDESLSGAQVRGNTKE